MYEVNKKGPKETCITKNLSSKYSNYVELQNNIL